MIGRRFFAAMIGTAPAALNVQRVTSAPSPQIGFSVSAINRAPSDAWIDKAAQEVTKPLGLEGFYKASQAYQNTKRYSRILQDARRDIQYVGGLSPNLAALKSVSHQHKIHMMVQHAIKKQQEDMSFMNKLKETFGVATYFKKMDEMNEVTATDSARSFY